MRRFHTQQIQQRPAFHAVSATSSTRRGSSCSMRGRYASSTARSNNRNRDGDSASMGRTGGKLCASGMKHY
jgi:hypothetical protein